MSETNDRMIKDTISGASKGALYGGALSIATGVALVATPVTTLFGLVTLGTTVAVAAPIVAAGAAAGAVVGGTAAAAKRYHKDKKNKELFDSYMDKK